MEFRLGFQRENELTGNIEFNFFEELSEDEFYKLSAALTKLEELKTVRRLSEFVLLNQRDLTDYLNRSVNELLNKAQNPIAGRGDELREVHVNVNRLVLNYLSSVRTFLDHTTTFLIRKFGEKEEIFLQFKQMLSDCYDQSFAYRFLSKLRNYAQHVDIPVSDIEFQMSYSEDRSKIQGTLSIDFSPVHLLDKFQKWGGVKKDLLEKTESFQLMPLIYEMTYFANLIERNTELIFKDELIEATDYIYEKVGSFSDEDGDVFIGYDFEDKEDGSLARFSQKFLSVETLKSVMTILSE